MISINKVNMTLQDFWPEWHVDQEIGEGSHGIVYRASNEGGETSAIKVISVPRNQAEVSAYMAEGNNELTTRAYFLDIVNDFVNEINFLDNLKEEEHVVHIEDHKVVAHEQEIGWDIYIRMELLTPCLAYFPKENINQDEIIRLGRDICKALISCSKLQIIHRDIKPENIFVSDDGVFKLGDFGVARQLDHKTSSLSQKGTYNYMAPEVFKGEGYTENVDLYSLGIVLYRFMNNNRAPFLSPDKQLITYKETMEAFERRMDGEEIPDPVHASPAFTALILKACRFAPEQRYQNAEEMLRSFEKVSESIAAGERAERALSRKIARSISVRRKARYIASIAAVCAVIAITLTAGVYLIYTGVKDTGQKEASTEDSSTKPKRFEAPANTPVMKIKDKNLELALRELTGIADGDLHVGDVWNVIYDNGFTLDLSGKGIKDISPLADMTLISDLNLSDNNISDLNNLGLDWEKLENLSKLSLNNNEKLVGISALGELNQLLTLEVNNTGIKEDDIISIGKMDQLEELSLGDMKDNESLSDLSALASLTHLKKLYLNNDELIQDFGFLKYLSGLSTLDLGAVNLSNDDLHILSDMKSLEELTIQNNKDITSLQPLSKLIDLTYLDVKSCSVADLSPVRDLTKLQSLDLSDNKISSIEDIKDLNQIVYLDLGSNSIESISALTGLSEELGTLYLQNNRISGNLDALADMKQLTTLDISNNNDISDMSALLNLKNNLRNLNYSEEQLASDVNRNVIRKLNENHVDLDPAYNE